MGDGPHFGPLVRFAIERLRGATSWAELKVGKRLIVLPGMEAQALTKKLKYPLPPWPGPHGRPRSLVIMTSMLA